MYYRIKNGVGGGGIGWRVVLYVVLPLWLILALGVGLTLHHVNLAQDERLKEDIKLIARAVSGPIGDALAGGDIKGVERTLSAVFSIGQVYGASVFDAEGRVLASSGIADLSLRNRPAATRVMRTGEQQELYQRTAGRDVFSHFVPLTDAGGRINGLIQITRRAKDFEQSFALLARTAWLGWLIFGVLMMGVVIWGHYRGLGRHVNGLVAVMDRVKAGDWQQRAALAGPQELRRIALGLNEMLGEIRNHRAQERALNRRLRHQQKMAAVGTVVGGIAHELGAPLNVIDGRARRLQKQTDEPEAQRQLGAIRGQVLRLSRIVRQLLDFSRPESRESEPVELYRLLAQSAAAVRYEQWSVAGLSLPPSGKPVWLRLDGARLELALVNVLRNALQAARSRVEVAVREQEGRLAIEISDDGPGFALDPEQLVAPFVTTKPKGEGTGLGLAIVHNIMAELDGGLTLTTAPGGGARVILTLARSSHAQGIHTAD
ncbi:ATP-binding protein [Zobellella iuensis]|uniref:histidine kinase n=1 Tax=Zobellella iuensis TaxID=2803811 RepID=A0ABS1QWV1_9GAMM|nr:ATP-binding protein [Zobellella iuensis]MBL1379339.1 sensor histidine kinase [Zobellella iuensis]